MSDFRARDADRERFAELIEAAYGEGLLGAHDRDLRVERALTAASIDELEALTRDLLPPAAGVVGEVPAAAVVPQVPAARPVPADEVGARQEVVVRRVVLTGFAVCGLGMAAFALSILAGFVTDYGTATDSPVVVRSEPAEESVVQEPDSFEMTPAGVRGFLRGYQAEFGTLDAFELVFHPTRVSMQVPVRGPRPRAERWSYDGAWHQHTEAAAVTGLDRTVDLGSVDVRRLFANIATAERELRVERGKLTHVAVRRFVDGTPTVYVYVGNRFNESGFLMTTVSGEILRRFPYSP